MRNFWDWQRAHYENSTSAEWRGVWSLVGRWHGVYSRETIERTARKLAQRYHVPAVPVPDGMTWNECRERYAAWKEVARVAWLHSIEWD